MKTILLIIIIGIVFLPISAHASCGAPPPLGAEYYNFQQADVVFVGTVIDIYNPHPEIHPGTEEYDTITFDVTRILKGDADDGTVTSGHNSIQYSDFEIGKSYLVYAFGDKRSVSICTPPVLLDESQITTSDFIYYVPLILVVTIVSICGIVIFMIWRKNK
ncbi:MAG: hypothetical protein KGZ34_00110 [Nitrosarchaeum sp.]|nr:hypothetical protein [Nitrosarchaeum sp.]